jgi:hypothetical protein
MRPVNSSMMMTLSSDDVVDVAREQLVRAQRLVDVVHQRDVEDVVEAAGGQQAGSRSISSIARRPARSASPCAASRPSRNPDPSPARDHLVDARYRSERSSVGPEMISGVRASSIRIESTSSTMA